MYIDQLGLSNSGGVDNHYKAIAFEVGKGDALVYLWVVVLIERVHLPVSLEG